MRSVLYVTRLLLRRHSADIYERQLPPHGSGGLMLLLKRGLFHLNVAEAPYVCRDLCLAANSVRVSHGFNIFFKKVLVFSV